MKKLLALGILVFLTLSATRGLRQEEKPAPPRGPTLEERVLALERALESETKAHAGERALCEQMNAYLQAQAKSAARMLEVLDESAKAGFTVGDNWRSREILVAGLREHWTNAQQDLPSAPAPALPAAPAAAPRKPQPDKR